MMQRSYIGEEKIHCDNGQDAILHYYLLKEKRCNRDSFGVEVAMLRDGKFESAAVHHITTSAARMSLMLDLLKRNTVTPCTLQEIVIEEVNKY